MIAKMKRSLFWKISISR